MKTTFREIDSPFDRCRKEKKQQQRLVALLAESRWQPELPTVVVIDLLCIPGDLGNVYLVADRPYLSREFFL